VNRTVAQTRITAMWAFTETTFGGLLHALHIPFKGIFIGGAAIIFITLIAYFSEQKYSIIKATIIVLIIKGLVSPYTPIAAYFSLLLQGILGQLLFINKKQISLSAFVLSISTMLLFGFQKVIIYTIIFGKTLWKSIDAITNFIIDQFHIVGQNSQTIHFSLILISIYVSIHIVAGIFIGIIAGRIPNWIRTSMYKNHCYIEDIQNESIAMSVINLSPKNRRHRTRKRIIIFLMIAIGALIFSYLVPHHEPNLSADIALMIFRATIIAVVWYFYIAPLLIDYSKRYLRKQRSIYAEEVREIINIFPYLKYLLVHCWTKSSEHKGFKKYRLFLSYSIITMLFTNFNLE
jgi:hypothetical protein